MFGGDEPTTVAMFSISMGLNSGMALRCHTRVSTVSCAGRHPVANPKTCAPCRETPSCVRFWQGGPWKGTLVGYATRLPNAKFLQGISRTAIRAQAQGHVRKLDLLPAGNRTAASAAGGALSRCRVCLKPEIEADRRDS
jgi:hypothetical protein